MSPLSPPSFDAWLARTCIVPASWNLFVQTFVCKDLIPRNCAARNGQQASVAMAGYLIHEVHMLGIMGRQWSYYDCEPDFKLHMQLLSNQLPSLQSLSTLLILSILDAHFPVLVLPLI